MKKIELQKFYYNCLKDLDSFCKQENIRYYLIGGTALGAVRHKGFIPWDDDIDVGMPIEDYKRFCKSANRMDNKYFMQTFSTDKKWYTMFGNLRVTGTTSMPVKLKALDVHWGMEIDIFPIIGVYRNKLLKKMQQKLFNFNMLLLSKDLLISIKQCDVKHIGKRRRILLCMPRLVRHMICNFNNLFVEKSFYWSEQSCVLAWEMVHYGPTQMYGNGTLLLFVDREFRVPADYKTYLTSAYGSDFMTLPPLEKRTGHEDDLGDIIYSFSDNYTEFR